MPITPVTELNAQAQAAWDAQQNEFRKAAAYNALNRMYGPVAGDPDSALKLQRMKYNEQMEPLQVENQRITNTGAEARNNYLNQSYPLLLQHQESVDSGQGIANDYNTEKLEQAKLSTNGQRALQVRGVLGGAMSDLGSQLDGVDDPNQRGAIFDQTVARVAPLVGADPRAISQQLAADRAAIVQGGAAALPKLKSDLDAAIYGSLSPKDRAAVLKSQASVLKTQADTELTNAKLKTEQNKLLTSKYGKPGDLQKDISAGQFLNARVGNVIGTVRAGDNGAVQYGTDGLIGQAFQLLSKLPQDGASLKAASLIPGSDAYKLHTVLDQISHNLSVDDLRNMKQSGLSLGRVTVAEFQAVSKAIANTDLAQGGAMLRTQLGRVGKMYSDLHAANAADIATMQGHLKALQGETGGTPPAQKMNFPAPPPESGAPNVPATTSAMNTGKPLPSQPTSPFALAQKWMGTNENTGRAALTAFFKKSGGQSIDPASTPWCAAFVNAVLGASGESGTGSLAARSFLNYGTATKKPSLGDIVVLSRGSDPSKGHVGFFAGIQTINGMQYVKVLGGNTGNKVAIAHYPLNRVLGYRHPPKAGEIKQAAAAEMRQQQPQGNGLMQGPANANTEPEGAGQAPQSTAQNFSPSGNAPAGPPSSGGDSDMPLAAPPQGEAGASTATLKRTPLGRVQTLGEAQAILRQMGVLQ